MLIRIRQNGAEWKMNKLNTLLIRKQDYQDHKDRFDKADTQLQELMRAHFR